MIASVAAAMALALVVSAAPGSALEKCRALDKEFDTKNMPKPCQAAADDTTLAIADRVEALRRLAFAHILNGDDALAEPAFLKMLVFSPTTELPADAGPRFREVFAGVKKRFDEEGKLGVTFKPPIVEDGPVEVQIDVADKLGRVTGARLRVTSPDTAKLPVPLEERLVRNELSPGNIRFAGRVPEPKPLPPEGITLAYEIVLETWDGSALESPVPLKGDIVRGSGSSSAVEGDAPPWGIIAASVGVGLVVVGAVTGGVIWCTTAGPCRQQEAWVRVQIGQNQ
jgi:hypothetical protein